MTAAMTDAARSIGYLPLPDDFEYLDVLRLGRPRHEKWDDFSLRHPPMTPARWAKIFSPFDALDGFNEAIASKEVVYEPRRHLGEEEQKELNRRLGLLHRLTWNLRAARANKVVVTVTFFVPCTDLHHQAFHAAGQYQAATGMVLRVGGGRLTLELTEPASAKRSICFSDIWSVERPSGAFDAEWEA